MLLNILSKSLAPSVNISFLPPTFITMTSNLVNTPISIDSPNLVNCFSSIHHIILNAGGRGVLEPTSCLHLSVSLSERVTLFFTIAV